MPQKRFYWIKLPENYFSRPAIIFILAQERGEEKFVLYLRLLTASISTGGNLRIDAETPYTWETLAIAMRTTTELVAEGMKAFMRMNLVKLLPDDTIYMTEQPLLTQSETASAQRMRELRQKRADVMMDLSDADPEISPCKGKKRGSSTGVFDPTASHCDGDIEIDIEIELEKEKEIEKEKEKKAASRRPQKKRNEFFEMLKNEDPQGEE